MNAVFVFVPIMVLGIGVAWIVSQSILKIQRLRLEEARLHAGDPADVSELAHQVSDLQQQLGEVQERLDFAERLLVKERETAGLPAPPPRAGQTDSRQEES